MSLQTVFLVKHIMEDAILKDLDEMIALLKEDGATDWARFFASAKQELEAGSVEKCALAILSGSGGMGSLNDLILGQTTDEGGNFAWKQGYEDMNHRYQALLGSLYSFSRRYRRIVS